MTVRGAAVLAAGALCAGCGLWWRYPGLTALGLALAAVVVLSFVVVLVASPVDAVREVRPRTVPRLAACTASVVVSGTGRLPVEVVDTVAGSPVALDIPESGRVSYPVPTQRRGVVAVGPLTVRRYGPAGLAVSSRVAAGEVTVRVVPRVLPVRGLPAGARRGQVGADERVERGGTDLVGLREYVPGDDLRRLHWATSARTGTLMIREDADPARPHLAVLLDDRESAHTAESFEEAVEVAASLVASAAADGHPVRLLSASGSVDVEVLEPDAAEALSALADVVPVAAQDVRPVPVRDLDVVAAIGSFAVDELILAAGRGAYGVVLSVGSEDSVSAGGVVIVLRGSSAEALLRAWDAVVL
ncbi:DUF58 domain-containing protein [Actinokineospora sp. UTMC 2448]|uniref:DUF58 domain-containing protein n=1 Tax=Actinokineospora sp. UTMC 2448 TaxID=2268449 RepID=UPI0021649FAD|nr:DUF58 domain-containing protein [Actinokineospora sp. UTMC 2448]UVS77770.1 hypothetical protein Actkin_01491 [Actinokineospora sp. UTMC 2448]